MCDEPKSKRENDTVRTSKRIETNVPLNVLDYRRSSIGIEIPPYSSAQDASTVVLRPISNEPIESPTFSLFDTAWIHSDWKSLPIIPLLYPIQRTNTIVQCSHPQIIAERIMRCLQKLSITAQIHSSDASLLAETLDHTEFCISLYNNNRYYNGEILVELQRIEGEAFNYMRYAQIIIAFIKGEEVNFESATKKCSSSASLSYIPASLSCRQRDVQNSHVNGVYHASTVENVVDLIKKDRIDARLLGMTSLLLLTDYERSKVSECVSELVLFGNFSGSTVVKDFVFNLIDSPPSGITSQKQSNVDFASRQQEIMRNTALAVIGNSLQCAFMSATQSLSSLMKSEEWMCKSGILDIILCELRNAQYKLHNAYQAARCLKILLRVSDEMKIELLKRGLMNLLRQSLLVGLSRHALLAHECNEALTLLSSSLKI